MDSKKLIFDIANEGKAADGWAIARVLLQLRVEDHQKMDRVLLEARLCKLTCVAMALLTVCAIVFGG